MQSQTTGERFKALLQAKNLTIASAAKKSSVSESILGRIANNRSAGISTTTLQLICKGLDCSPADILGQEPEQPSGADPVTYAIETLRHAYEDRLLAMTEVHLDELDRLEKSHAKLIDDIKKERIVWHILSFCLTALIITWFIWYITHPRAGLIQYDTAGRVIGLLG